MSPGISGMWAARQQIVANWLESLGRLVVIWHPNWTGVQPISWNPTRVPALKRGPAKLTFKATDLAQNGYDLGSIINRPTIAGPTI